MEQLRAQTMEMSGWVYEYRDFLFFVFVFERITDLIDEIAVSVRFKVCQSVYYTLFQLFLIIIVRNTCFKNTFDSIRTFGPMYNIHARQ